jgi:hypothetical protein
MLGGSQGFEQIDTYFRAIGALTAAGLLRKTATASSRREPPCTSTPCTGERLSAAVSRANGLPFATGNMTWSRLQGRSSNHRVALVSFAEAVLDLPTAEDAGLHAGRRCGGSWIDPHCRDIGSELTRSASSLPKNVHTQT